MKILLMCGAGASSGFMAQAMRKAAKAEGLTDLEIIARSDSEMMSNLKGTDLIMFGPHLAYKEDALAKDLAPHNIPYCIYLPLRQRWMESECILENISISQERIIYYHIASF